MRKIYTLFTILIIYSCATPQEKISSSAVLVTNVNIIDVRTGNVTARQQVVIDSGKIKQIVDTIKAADQYKTIVSAEGKFLIPGLAEMHAHIPQPPTTTLRTEETLFLYLSNGITTIRGMLGHPSHLKLREQAASGVVLSPRIFTASPSLNGNSIPSEELAKAKVKAYQLEGYDFLKMHPGIKRHVFDAAVTQANEVGIPFAGHVPVDVGIRHALASKFASIDHVDGFLEGLVPASLEVDPSENGFFGFNFTPLADIEKIDELVQLAAENEVWIVPTQSLFERWFAPITAEEMLQAPEMKYMPTSTLKNWAERKNEYTGPDANFDKDQWEQFTTIRRSLIKALQDNGHGMLLGSDAPQLFNVPGFSIHHEIQGMLKAGLTPLQILQSGTINPAIYFNMEDTFGEVKEGLSADLVLLNTNPLDDINALKDIAGVWVQGKWVPKTTINEKLKEIAKNAAKN